MASAAGRPAPRFRRDFIGHAQCVGWAEARQFLGSVPAPPVSRLVRRRSLRARITFCVGATCGRPSEATRATAGRPYMRGAGDAYAPCPTRSTFHVGARPAVALGLPCGNITPMALAQKRATTIALEPAADRLLTRAARSTGVSRSEFIRRQLDIVLEQYRPHPRPRSAGVIKSPLAKRGDEAELFLERR